LIHTEIDPEFERQGLGKKLVAAALDDVRRTGNKVIPLCPFVSRFIERNDAYGDLVAPSYKR
jgi:predicted GNAT family acetyltransferase